MDQADRIRPRGDAVLLDAGVVIAALLEGDSRHDEAYPLVEGARLGVRASSVTAGIVSEVYAALTWKEANPHHSPTEAAEAVRRLIEPPSALVVLSEDLDVALLTLALCAKHYLTARRVHDARHAAAAIVAGISGVCTYDPDDWGGFQSDGLRIVGPPSTLARLPRVGTHR